MPFLILLYPFLKLAAYSGWCWYGLTLLNPTWPRRPRLAFTLGLVRLLMGLFFGVVIGVLAEYVYTGLSGARGASVVTYLSVYVPVRWVEWTIMSFLIEPSRLSVRFLLAGSQPLSPVWRLGGIVISCLSDIPMIAFLGGHLYPVGRFLC